jgi:hypothetical protein
MQEGEQVIQDVEKALDELKESPGRRRNAAAEGLINGSRRKAASERRPSAQRATAGSIGSAPHEPRGRRLGPLPPDSSCARTEHSATALDIHLSMSTTAGNWEFCD